MLSFRILEVEVAKRPFNAKLDDPALGSIKNLQVPYLRIYGYLPTKMGKKVICHLNHVFPYVLVKCPQELQRSVKPSETIETMGKLSRQLEAALYHAIKKDRPQYYYGGLKKDPGQRYHFIYKILLCHAHDFYGYHGKDELFFKILFLDPSILGYALNILGNSELCLGQKHKTFYAHIPFMLQVMVDFNLFGMDWIHLSHYRFRGTGCSESKCQTGPITVLNDLSAAEAPNIDPAISSSEAWFNTQRKCHLWNAADPMAAAKDNVYEIDTFAFAIVNRHLFANLRMKMKRQIGPSGAIRGEFDKSRCAVPSLETIWREEQDRCRSLGLVPPEWDIETASRNDRDATAQDPSSSGPMGSSSQAKSVESFFDPNIPCLFDAVEAAYPRSFFITGSQPVLLQLPSEDAFSESQLAVMSQEQKFDFHADEDFILQCQTQVTAEKLLSDVYEDNNREDEEEEKNELVELVDRKDEFEDVKDDGDDNEIDLMAAILEGKHPGVNELKSKEDLKVKQDADRKKRYLKTKKKKELRKRYSQNSMVDLLQLNCSSASTLSGKRPRIIDDISMHSPEMGPKKIRLDQDEFQPEIIACGSPTMKKVTTFLPINQVRFMRFKSQPPSQLRVLQDAHHLEFRRPFYSNPRDCKKYIKGLSRYRQRDGPAYVHDGTVADFNPPLGSVFSKVLEHSKTPPREVFIIDSTQRESSSTWLEYLYPAPRSRNLLDDLGRSKARTGNKNFSQVEAMTPTDSNPHKFLISQKEDDAGGLRVVEGECSELSGITIACMEILCSRRGNLLPDPEVDCIEFICVNYSMEGREEFAIVYATGDEASFRFGLDNSTEIKFFQTELQMVKAFVEHMIISDPDIIVSFDLSNRASLGYMCERVQKKYNFNVEKSLGRTISVAASFQKFDIKKDEWGHKKWTGIHVSGRLCIPVWKIMRDEVTGLRNYSREEITFHVLHERIGKPLFASPVVSSKQYAFTSKIHEVQQEKMSYLLFITRLNKRLLMHPSLNVLSKAIQFSLTFGTPLFSTLTRGSQFKVESMMSRVCLLDDFVLLSATAEDVREMEAPTGIPLILEPVSGLYTRPILVFDFQSLYPSIMIAYNYCYSTIVEKKGSKTGKLGFSVMNKESQQLTDLTADDMERKFSNIFTKYIYMCVCLVAPNGVYYVKKRVRGGVLGRLLTEILQTRVMVKNAMKRAEYDDFKSSLKLISNVTYGYTSASFSGRMPNVHVADSIVLKGREILSRTRVEIEKEFPGCSVKYGDTDSLFVMLDRHETMESCMRLGQKIAKHVTASVRSPMKLKFEKVYLPAILQTKKRYVGLKFESVDDPGEFEAKGIETVRRDGTPLLAKVMERSLMTLFKTLDLSLVKEYLLREFEKIMTGRVPLTEFMFCKEVKMANYTVDSATKNLPPAAKVQLQLNSHDPMNMCSYGERIPYIVTYSLDKGMKESRLKDCVLSPLEWILDPEKHRINTRFYIYKGLLRPLQRLFGMMNVNMEHWVEGDMCTRDYLEFSLRDPAPGKGRKTTLDQFCISNRCFFCDKSSAVSGRNPQMKLMCRECIRIARKDPFVLQKMAFTVGNLSRQIESNAIAIFAIQCKGCRTKGYNSLRSCSAGTLFYCGDWNCPYLYDGIKAERRLSYCQALTREFYAEFSSE